MIVFFIKDNLHLMKCFTEKIFSTIKGKQENFVFSPFVTF